MRTKIKKKKIISINYRHEDEPVGPILFKGHANPYWILTTLLRCMKGTMCFAHVYVQMNK